MAATRITRAGYTMLAWLCTPDLPLLEGLSEVVEDIGRELPELVEEKHAVVCAAELARPHLRATPAQERYSRSAVMGRPERRPADQCAGRQGQTGSRVNSSHLEGTVGFQWRQEPHEALGKHGLSRPRWPHEEEMVTAGRGHLERQAGTG